MSFLVQVLDESSRLSSIPSTPLPKPYSIAPTPSTALTSLSLNSTPSTNGNAAPAVNGQLGKADKKAGKKTQQQQMMQGQVINGNGVQQQGATFQKLPQQHYLMQLPQQPQRSQQNQQQQQQQQPPPLQLQPQPQPQPQPQQQQQYRAQMRPILPTQGHLQHQQHQQFVPNVPNHSRHHGNKHSNIKFGPRQGLPQPNNYNYGNPNQIHHHHHHPHAAPYSHHHHHHQHHFHQQYPPYNQYNANQYGNQLHQSPYMSYQQQLVYPQLRIQALPSPPRRSPFTERYFARAKGTVDGEVEEVDAEEIIVKRSLQRCYDESRAFAAGLLLDDKKNNASPKSGPRE